MSKIKLEVFIGNCFQNENKDVKVVIVVNNPYFPHGDIEEENGINFNRFKSFYNAGTFIADLGDMMKYFGLNRYNITAKVHLNIKSNIKTLNYIELISFFDYLHQHRENYSEIRDFNECGI